MENADQPPSCSVSGSRAPRNRQEAEDDAADQQLQHAGAPREHDIFGDWNLIMVMMFLLMLHFMQYAMRPPCGC